MPWVASMVLSPMSVPVVPMQKNPDGAAILKRMFWLAGKRSMQ